MHRVVILGSSGAGKSTLARALGARTGLPVVHLDRVFWKPGWVEPTREEFEAKHDAVMSGERWIIDGNYSRVMPRRLEAADTIVLLDLPRRECVAGILRRWLLGYRRGRPDITEGCPNKMDWAFFKWTWEYRERSRPRHLALVEVHRGDKAVIVLRSRHAAARWLRGIERKAT